jgi:hypothetical protein
MINFHHKRFIILILILQQYFLKFDCENVLLNGHQVSTGFGAKILDGKF